MLLPPLLLQAVPSSPYSELTMDASPASASIFASSFVVFAKSAACSPLLQAANSRLCQWLHFVLSFYFRGRQALTRASIGGFLGFLFPFPDFSFCASPYGPLVSASVYLLCRTFF